MYDTIIIGGGPAGISASLYTVRAGLSTLIIAKGWGSLEKAEKVQNYYGLGSDLTGKELLKNGLEQARKLGVDIIEDEIVGLNGFDGIIVQGLKDEYRGKVLILAMGSPRRKLPFKNLDEFEGKGISYCAACDGFFYRDKKIAVIGYNEYMAHEAVEIKEISSNVTVLTNEMPFDVLKKDMAMIDGLRTDSEKIKGFYGDEYLLGVEFESGRKEEYDGVFLAYGSATGMEMALKTGLIHEKGAITVDEKQCTNLPSIFAAGDCTGGFKQVSVAVGEGAVAAKSALEYIRSIK
ncbi:MAG: NAD(P)/FAD-dependent oxidoreductase [Clostridiales bacterium]|nr:NAD(P)/FAD-dependent oxidoreductase [Clostridiales bacterium]